MRYVDPDGETAVISGLIGFGIGAVVGVAGVAISAVMGAEVTVADFVGGAVSEAVTGGILGLTGNFTLAKTTSAVAVTAVNVAVGAGAAALGNLAKQGTNIKVGKQDNFDVVDLVADTAIGGLNGVILSGCPVKGLNSGRGSMQAAAKQMITKGNTSTLHTSFNVAVVANHNAALEKGTVVTLVEKNVFDAGRKIVDAVNNKISEK